MDYLTQQEIKGFKQDIKHAAAKDTAEKHAYERKLLEGLGEEMEREIENPDEKKRQKIAKKYAKKKKLSIWKENFKKIFGGDKKKEVI